MRTHTQTVNVLTNPGLPSFQLIIILIVFTDHYFYHAQENV